MAFLPVLVSAYDVGYGIGFALALFAMLAVLVSPVVVIVWLVRRRRRRHSATLSPYYPQPSAVFAPERWEPAQPKVSPHPRFCRRCGSLLVDDARYCDSCGTRVSIAR